MSFNIRYDNPDDGNNTWVNRKEAVVRMISEIDPDIVGFQEVLAEQYAYLAGNLAGYDLFGVGRDNGADGGEMAAIAFKNELYELAESGNFWLSETPDSVSRGWDAVCNRIATWVELREKGSERSFWVFNTHLDHIGQTARQEGTKLLIRKIDEFAGKGTVFITGDFNAGTQDEVLQPLFSQFGSARENASETDKSGTFNGFGSAPSSIILDHIFYRNATPESFRTVSGNYGVAYISDHYPVVAKFVF